RAGGSGHRRAGHHAPAPSPGPRPGATSDRGTGGRRRDRGGPGAGADQHGVPARAERRRLRAALRGGGCAVQPRLGRGGAPGDAPSGRRRPYRACHHRVATRGDRRTGGDGDQRRAGLMREPEATTERRALLLAHPAGHSLSPVMHDAGFRALGIDARYEAWDVPPEGLPDAVRALRGPGFLGANVTVPHKRAVASLVDDLDPEARAIGAVNTIVKQEGRLVGRNTDAPGFLAALRETEFEPSGRRCLVLGAGGAARAVTWALVRAGAEVHVANRSEDRARDLAAELAAADTVQAGPRWLPNHDVAAALPGFDLL